MRFPCIRNRGNGVLPRPNNNQLALPAPVQPVNNGQRNSNMPFRRQLTQRELEEKRAKHQCFYCDQKYSPGHKCSGQMYSLEVISESMVQEECL